MNAITQSLVRAESPARRTLWASVFSYANLALKVGSNFIIIPLALKYLGREQYAIWILFQSLATYLALAEFGMGQSVVNFQNAAFARHDMAGVNRILATTFATYVMIAGAVWGLCSLLVWTQPVHEWLLRDATYLPVATIKLYLFLSITFSLLRVPFLVMPATLLGLRETMVRQLVELIVTALPFAGAVLTLLLHGRLLSLLVVTNTAIICASMIAYALVRWRHADVRLSLHFYQPSLVRPLLTNSSFFALYNVGMLFQRLTGTLLAGKFAPLAQVPEFFILLTLFRVVGWAMADTVSSLLMPYIVLFDIQEKRRRVLFFAQLCTKLTFALALTFSALLWIFAQAGIRVWLGPNMFLGYPALACLAASFLLDVLFLAGNNFMRALNRHRPIAITMAAYAILSLGLGVFFARRWNFNPMLGLCFGLLLASFFAQALPMAWITVRWLEVDPRHYLAHFLLRPLVLALAAAAVLAAARLQWMGTGIPALVITALLIIFLLASLLWLSLDRDEKKWIAHRWAQALSLCVPEMK